MKSFEFWKKFWEGRSDAAHPEKSQEFYTLHGAELRLLFSGASLERVLEIGCGAGELFGYLGIEPDNYRGVDISRRMLGAFREKHGDLDLVLQNGDVYEDNGQYSLIFSNQVLQHFTQDMFERHIAASVRMLAPGGRLVCASLPWKALRADYSLGDTFTGRAGMLKRLAIYLRRCLPDNPMGRWYSWKEVETVAEKNGLTSMFFGSLKMPYRFHGVMWRRTEAHSFLPVNEGDTSTGPQSKPRAA
jgi:SAM-dependent methyltransferase